MGRNYKRSQSAGGFTLVELMLAMTITALIVVFMMRAFSGATATWRESEERTDTFREARAALEIIARDLGKTGSAPNAPMLVLDYSTDTITEDKAANHEVYAVTASPSSGRTDLCTVGYFCRWDDQHHCYVLKRLFNDSNATFLNFKYGAATPMTFDSIYNSPASNPNKLRGTYAAAQYNNSAFESDVASYIWDLRVSAFENGSAVTYPQTYPTKYSDPLPAWIEVGFKAIGVQAAQRLKDAAVTRDTWNPAANTYSATYKNLILPYQQQFSMRIPLPAGR